MKQNTTPENVSYGKNAKADQNKTLDDRNQVRNASIGGSPRNTNLKANLIEGIISLSQMNGPTGPMSDISSTKNSGYNVEDLSKKSVWDLRCIYRRLKNPLPLSKRYNRQDRRLAAKCNEYKQVLEQIRDLSDPKAATDIGSIDLTKK